MYVGRGLQIWPTQKFWRGAPYEIKAMSQAEKKRMRGPFDRLSFLHADADIKQESCAIAKMTAQCAIYMGALKIFATP